MLAHLLEHIAVADRRAYQRDARLREIALEPEIGHHGRDDRRACASRPSAFQLSAITASNLVAVDDPPALVDDQHPVGVAVERDADIGAHFLDLLAERRRFGRAAFVVDVEAVRLDADRDHFGVEFLQRLRRDLVGRAIGAVDDDAQTLKREILRQRALGELDIAILHAIDAPGAPERGGAWRAA